MKMILLKSGISSCGQLFASSWNYKKLRIRYMYTYTYICITDMSTHIFFMANSSTLAVSLTFLRMGHSNAQFQLGMVNCAHQHRKVAMQLPKNGGRNFPSALVAKSLCYQCGGPGLIPGQRTRSHIPQLTVPGLQLKIPCVATKTWHSQINKINILKKFV